MSYALEQARLEYVQLQAKYDELAEGFEKAEARIEMLERCILDFWEEADDRGRKCEPRMDGAHLSYLGTFGPDNCPLCIGRKLMEEQD